MFHLAGRGGRVQDKEGRSRKKSKTKKVGAEKSPSKKLEQKFSPLPSSSLLAWLTSGEASHVCRRGLTDEMTGTPPATGYLLTTRRQRGGDEKQTFCFGGRKMKKIFFFNAKQGVVVIIWHFFGRTVDNKGYVKF